MSLLDRRDGFYDENGRWQRTKFCFMYCGDRCTCKPPFGYYNAAYDKSLQKKDEEEKYPFGHPKKQVNPRG